MVEKDAAHGILAQVDGHSVRASGEFNHLSHLHVVESADLGDAVADRIGPVWGFDDGGELRNMWAPTAQEGLWFTAGSLAQCRIYSRYLALQIKAREDGLVA